MKRSLRRLHIGKVFVDGVTGFCAYLLTESRVLQEPLDAIHIKDVRIVFILSNKWKSMPFEITWTGRVTPSLTLASVAMTFSRIAKNYNNPASIARDLR